MVNGLYKAFRPFLFQLDAEKAHHLAVAFLARKRNCKIPGDDQLTVPVAGFTVKNPIGMAAGFDKYGTCFQGLATLGLSFAELGTFTPRPQEGNAKPRLFRVKGNFALVNRMGFNNPGIENALLNIKKNLAACNEEFQIGMSLGKQKETPNEDALSDYLYSLDKIAHEISSRVAYIAINISSPNTPGLRELQSREYLSDLVSQCKKHSPWPLFIKLAPDFDDMNDFTNTVEIALGNGANGLIISNTTSNLGLLSHTPAELKGVAGGLSGFPLRDKARALLQKAREIAGYKVPIIASGGVMTKEDAWDRLMIGANLVQVYTGLVYGGPGFVYDCLEYVRQQLQRQKVSLREFESRRN